MTGNSPNMADRLACAMRRCLNLRRRVHAYGNPDLADLAASLACGLVRNHPFMDGNKRTTRVCYRTFLLLNGADLVATSEQKYTHMLGLADGSLPEADLAAWLRQLMEIETPPDAAQETQAGYAAR